MSLCCASDDGLQRGLPDPPNLLQRLRLYIIVPVASNLRCYQK
jgi:hypothetical protein